jgi:hypothetical protein
MNHNENSNDFNENLQNYQNMQNHYALSDEQHNNGDYFNGRFKNNH